MTRAQIKKVMQEGLATLGVSYTKIKVGKPYWYNDNVINVHVWMDWDYDQWHYTTFFGGRSGSAVVQLYEFLDARGLNLVNCDWWYYGDDRRVRFMLQDKEKLN